MTLHVLYYFSINFDYCQKIIFTFIEYIKHSFTAAQEAVGRQIINIDPGLPGRNWFGGVSILTEPLFWERK